MTDMGTEYSSPEAKVLDVELSGRLLESSGGDFSAGGFGIDDWTDGGSIGGDF